MEISCATTRCIEIHRKVVLEMKAVFVVCDRQLYDGIYIYSQTYCSTLNILYILTVVLLVWGPYSGAVLHKIKNQIKVISLLKFLWAALQVAVQKRRLGSNFVCILSVYSPFSDWVGHPLHIILSPLLPVMDIFSIYFKFSHVRFYTL